MASSRVTRGRKTQSLIAQWFRGHGCPDAEPCEAFLPGVDVRNVPGLAIEVKATAKGDLLAALRQAANNTDDSACQTPVVIWRPNGYGEQRIDEWVVAMTLKDFTAMYETTRRETQ